MNSPYDPITAYKGSMGAPPLMAPMYALMIKDINPMYAPVEISM